MLSLSYPRLRRILLILITANREVPNQLIANQLGISERTVRSDIRTLNSDLDQFNVQVVLKRNKGYFLNAAKDEYLKNLKQEISADNGAFDLNSSEDRIKYLLFLLISQDKEVDIDQLLDKLFISSRTLDSYLIDLKARLGKYGLQIVKKDNFLKLVGGELPKRESIIDILENKNYSEYVLGFSEKEKQIFKNVDLSLLTQFVTPFLNQWTVGDSDFNRKNILVHFAIVLSRIGFQYDKNDVDKLPAVDVRRDFDVGFNNLILKVEKAFHVTFSKFDRDYLLYHFAVNDSRIITSKLADSDQAITNCIEQFLSAIYQRYAFDLTNDTVLKDNLFDHLKSVLKIDPLARKRKNPLLDVILSTFPLAYEVTATSIEIIEKGLSITLSTDEISFITLHIGASLERNYNTTWKKRNTAIICGSGTATAALLKSKLSQKFGDYLNITGIYSFSDLNKSDLSENDFLISTVPILNSKLLVVKIDLANYATDSVELYDYLKSTAPSQNKLLQLFDKNDFYVQSTLTDKREILEFLSDSLKKSGVADASLIHGVFAREALYSTAIGSLIAIPHPLSANLKESRIGFLALKSPVEWDENNMKVKYVFLLAIKTGDYPKVRPLFDFLVALQSQHQFSEMMDRARTNQDGMNVISKLLKQYLAAND